MYHPARKHPFECRTTGRWLILGACWGMFGLPAAFGGDGSWNVNGSGAWSTAASWSGSVVPPGTTSGTTSADIATFSYALTTGSTVTVDANRNIGSIVFGNASSFGFTLSGGSLLLSNGGSIQSAEVSGAHTDTISSNIVIQGNGGGATFLSNSYSASNTLLINGAVSGVSTTGNVTTLTLSGANTGASSISGAISDGLNSGKLAVTKNGSGTWTLSGNNTFTGTLTVEEGTLKVTSANGMGGGTGTVVLGAVPTAPPAPCNTPQSSTTRKFTMADGAIGNFLSIRP